MGGIKIFALLVEPGTEAHQFAIGGGDGFAGDVVAEHGGALADECVEVLGMYDLLLWSLFEEIERTA